MNTIAAISTPNAAGGIAMIRISGSEALTVAERVFQPVNGKKITEMQGYTCVYGSVSENGTVLDDAVLTVFRAPHSFTGEDTAEITCHGGIYVTKRILSLVYAAGASPAGPGEFTKRAFLNGKMSLTQAEAVMDVIRAEGEYALRQASMAREGRLGTEMRALSGQLVSLLAALSYWMDDAEEEPPELDHSTMLKTLNDMQERMFALSNHYRDGRILREGIRTVLLGLPNAGKSSVMNWLCGSERSIVTAIPGTTRDVVREYIRIDDFTLVLSDTAGIRETGNEIEAIGIAQAKRESDQADLILYVIDASAGFSDYDRMLLNELEGRHVVVLWNKTDLTENPPPQLPFPVVECSAPSETDTRKLSSVLTDLFSEIRFSAVPSVMNERQNQLILKSAEHIGNAINGLEQNIPLDLLYTDLELAAKQLEEIEGEHIAEETVETVFSKFCVGK
ncbi:MAG: tRNA uridine-5-carboxymethylaminomethyl(34) synthesis GTPase MnmE [Oscillospiraceae bacterium]|nr:tRNA uridine-5-carboxymethylaminomethyl(34) synthesis GTPase MnmE [Oscillospiraceae bacterium]